MIIRFHICLCVIVVLQLSFTQSVSAQKISTTSDIDWSSFLSKHDMVWDTITADYYAGAITGNGLMGNSIYKEDDGYKFHIGRVDVTEGRMPADKQDYSNLYHGARLPIGYFLLKPGGEVVSDNMRLSLWDAVISGNIVTRDGGIRFKSYTHALKDVIVLETENLGSEGSYGWEWKPLKAISPRYVFGQQDYPQAYVDKPNPDVKIKNEGNYGYSIQNLLGGKTYVVAWHDEAVGDKRKILITISHEASEDAALAKAKYTLDDALGVEAVALQKTHSDWWHNYYPASFLSLGDAKMESFYWIQQYKFGCITRPDKHIIDLQGPWAMEKTPWPAIWVNLNVQLTYSPLFTANRSAMSEPLWRSLNDNIDALHDNVVVDDWKKDAITIGRSTSYHLVSLQRKDSPNKMMFEAGNLPWILFYYWQYCRWQGDDKELVDKLFPLLKESINYYGYIREKVADGKYHMPETASPEYGTARDCNYDLALLRWGLTTLLDIDKEFKLKDSKRDWWIDFLDNLVDYPADSEQGFMIGANLKLTSSHRHYSHLLMIYPLYEINWDQSYNQDIIRKSLEHWQSMPAYLQGYSFTGSSSIYSMMGDGDRAVSQLQKLIKNFIKPNTLYRETGPVIETPLAGASSIQDLVLQSWGDMIRVFPSIPYDWQESSFIDLRADGAFLVSASRQKGVTSFIQIKSEKGGVCRLQTGMKKEDIVVRTSRGKKVKFQNMDNVNGAIEFNTRAGDVIQIFSSNHTVSMPGEVNHDGKKCNGFGVRKM